MTWQQFFLGLHMAWGLFAACREAVRLAPSSGRAVLLLAVVLAYFVAMFYALASGGFW